MGKASDSRVPNEVTKRRPCRFSPALYGSCASTFRGAIASLKCRLRASCQLNQLDRTWDRPGSPGSSEKRCSRQRIPGPSCYAGSWTAVWESSQQPTRLLDGKSRFGGALLDAIQRTTARLGARRAAGRRAGRTSVVVASYWSTIRNSLDSTLESIVVELPEGAQRPVPPMGYDNPSRLRDRADAGFQPPERIARRNWTNRARRPTKPGGRVVERTLGWLSEVPGDFTGALRLQKPSRITWESAPRHVPLSGTAVNGAS